MSACLHDRSSIDSTQTKCYWDSMSETCHYQDMDDSLSEVASVAILCSLIGAPLALCVQLIVSKILSAPVSKNRSKSMNQSQSKFKRLSELFQVNLGSIDETTTVLDPMEVFRLRSKLMKDFQSYRLILSEDERHELDGK